MKISTRELFIWIALLLGVFIVLTTELLSLFNSLNRLSILFCWIALIVFGLIKLRNCFRYLSFNVFQSKYFSFDFVFIAILSLFVILFATFLTSLIYPPNTPDAMIYHMPKVMQWIQNQNVNFFSTSNFRQLIMPPFPEFVILHLQLITDGDRLANLAQWFSMLGSLIGVSLIAREFCGNTKSQVFSALFCATIPMGILQSTSTQTDYIVSFWIIALVYFLLCYIRSGSATYIYAFAVSLGLAIFTKPTAYLFAFPFCIWFFIHLIREKRYHFIHLLLIPIIILTINIGHFARNIDLYSHPFGINLHVVNQVFTPTSVLSNLIRNIGLNLTVPNVAINEMIREVIISIHSFIGASVEDPKTTLSTLGANGGAFFIYFSLYESTAPNTLHFLVIILIICMMSFRGLFSSLQLSYILSIVIGFILFSIVLKWMPWGNRLMLPLFVLFAPIVGFSLTKIRLKIISNIVVLFVIFYALPYTFMNKTRPLIGTIHREGTRLITKAAPVWTNNRDKLYFTANPKLYEPFKKTSKLILKNNCNRIGLNVGTSDWEYPLWIFTRKKTSDPNFKIFHINVSNKSKNLVKNKIKEKPCAVFQILSKSTNANKFSNKFNNKISWFPISFFY